MTVHERRRPPSGHGELLCVPPFDEWSAMAERVTAGVATWPQAMQDLRACARAETVAEAERFSGSLGLPESRGWDARRIVMTGHQPELYHPGVWVKDFLVQRFSEEQDALGLDVVVDTDACDGVTLRVPVIDGDVRVESIALVEARGESAYVQAPVPDAEQRAAFRRAGHDALATLTAPALQRHFELFCDALDAAAQWAGDVGTLLTSARRRYEALSETTYLEVLLSRQSQSPSFRSFAAGLLVDAPRVRFVVNEALAAFRTRTGTRSVAQPFPDLGAREGRVEVPFWLLRDGRRVTASVDASGLLHAADEPILALGPSAESAAAALAEAGLILAPKALALTLFQRLFVADVFIHGTGGGRYDQVTDAVIAAYYGIEAPPYAVASMTLLLPLGACVVSDEDVTAVEQRLHRFEHNPDSILPEVEFDTPAERRIAEDLARAKADLVAAIALPDADRKTLGREIRDMNGRIASVLEPVARELRASLARTRAERDASAVLTDRTYPYCLWDPREVLDKVR